MPNPKLLFLLAIITYTYNGAHQAYSRGTLCMSVPNPKPPLLTLMASLKFRRLSFSGALKPVNAFFLIHQPAHAYRARAFSVLVAHKCVCTGHFFPLQPLHACWTHFIFLPFCSSTRKAKMSWRRCVWMQLTQSMHA